MPTLMGFCSPGAVMASVSTKQKPLFLQNCEQRYLSHSLPSYNGWQRHWKPVGGLKMQSPLTQLSGHSVGEGVVVSCGRHTTDEIPSASVTFCRRCTSTRPSGQMQRCSSREWITHMASSAQRSWLHGFDTESEHTINSERKIKYKGWKLIQYISKLFYFATFQLKNVQTQS